MVAKSGQISQKVAVVCILVRNAEGGITKYMVKAQPGEEILHVDKHVEIRSHDENEMFEVILEPAVMIPKTPGRFLDDFNHSSSEENRELGIRVSNERNIVDEVGVVERGGKSKKLKGKENRQGKYVDEEENLNIKRSKLVEKKEIVYSRRPVMVPTSEEEIQANLRDIKDAYPEINENMAHSLRFWLAYKLSVASHREKKPICDHFGIKVDGVNKAIRDGKEPKDSFYLSPGEVEARTRNGIIDRFGRPEDQEKKFKKYNFK